MVELSLRKRVELENTGQRRKSVLNRKVICKNSSPTGDALMDEALKHLKETEPTDTVGNWIELFCGTYDFCFPFLFSDIFSPVISPLPAEKWVAHGDARGVSEAVESARLVCLRTACGF